VLSFPMFRPSSQEDT